MKKLISLSLAIVLFAGVFAGCAKTDDTTATTDKVDQTYVILDEALSEEEYSIGFRKADVALCQAVEKALAEMQADGTFASIDKEWFGEEVNILDETKIMDDATDDSLLTVQAVGKFVLGLDASFPPMGFTDNDDNIVGYDIDLAKAVCEILGVELELQPIKWEAKEQEINSGNIDCIWNGFTTTPEREDVLCMSTPYLTNSQVVVTLSGSGITTLADLVDKTMSIQGGSTAGDALDNNLDVKNNLKGGAAIEVDNNVLAMFDLKAGGSDAVLMDKIVAEYYVTNPNA
jgi:ABC-type amino acid transport substrate-binding protein